MEEITEIQLTSIKGGFSISGSLINATARLIGSLLDLGRSLGSGVRRISSGKVCPV